MPERGAGEWTEGFVGGGIGMLVLKGILIRRVGIEGRFGAELVGEGDLLRPWYDEQDSPLLPLQTAWSVVRSARVAVLDEEFVQTLRSYPELASVLVGRAMQRARNLAVIMAIVHQSRVDTRIHMLLWHMAGRWGRVRRDATIVPIRLTHAALAELVAARRQTVTSAISELTRNGHLSSEGDVWLLHGDPPRELLEFHRRPAQDLAAHSPTASAP